MFHFSPRVLGHSPDQLSTRWLCCSGKGVCDDLHRNSSERTDSGSKDSLDWSRWKSHWCREYHCGTNKHLWPCEQSVPDTALPTVTGGRAILLQGHCHHPSNWDLPLNICIQGTSCDRYGYWYVLILDLMSLTLILSKGHRCTNY